MDAGSIVQKCNQGFRCEIQFKDIAEFQMIKTATIPVIIALEPDAVSMVNQLDFIEHAGKTLRKLQQYTVQIYSFQFEEISSWLEHPLPGINVLRSPELYSDDTGLKCKSPEGEAFFG